MNRVCRADLALLAVGGRPLLREQGGPLAAVVAVVAGVRARLAVAQIDDPLHRRIQEVGLVRDDQHRALVGLQMPNQPCPRGGVEVVGGLVQQQVIGATHEHLRQRDAHPPATGERSAGLAAVAGCEAQPAQHLPDPLVDAIAVQVVELVEQLRLPADQRVDVVPGALERGGDLLQLLLDGAGLRKRLPHLLDQRQAAAQFGILLQEAQAAAAMPGAARVGRVQPRDDAQQRGLAGPVWPNQPHPLAVAHGQADLVQDGDALEALGHGIDVEHG